MTSASHFTALRKFLYLLLIFPLTTATAFAGTVDEGLDNALGPIADFLDGVIFFSLNVAGQGLPIVLIFLGGTAIFLTIYFKFANVSSIGTAIKTVRGKYTAPDAPGQITHFQALSAALSATVGLGNIAGVAVAIGLGGPGATFWMILMGLCGMTTKFCECTLGVKYRKIDSKGRVSGGAMYYLSEGLKEKGLAKLGLILAIFFAVMCIGGAIGAGNMFQVNQAASQISDSFGIFQESKIGFGITLSILVGLVIIGGIVSIARVTSILVPFMCGMYVLATLVILFVNADQLGDAISQIITGAFAPTAIGGGLVGVLIQGIKRAAFSNEAGIGSAPIAHSAVKTEKPASEGMVALLEPFTDTVVVCTMTALVLIVTGSWKVDAIVEQESVALYAKPNTESIIVQELVKGEELRISGKDEDGKFGEVHRENKDSVWVEMETVKSLGGIQKTSRAFEGQFTWFPKLLAIAVLLFAFSTMISWSYYGEQAVNYLCGGNNPAAILIYKLFFCGFVVVGSVASLDNVLKLSDAMLFAMVIPNLIGVYLLLPVVKKELNIFRKHVDEIEGK